MRSSALSLPLAAWFLASMSAGSRGGGGAPPAATTNATAPGTIQLFPGYHSELSQRFFFNPKDEFYRNRYVSELNVQLDYVVLAIGRQTTLNWDMQLRTGMGEATSSHLPFAVNEVHYHLGPFAEFHCANWLWRIGWDHGCSHLVNKFVANPWYADTSDVVLRDVYYNRIFVGIGSPFIRPSDYRAAFGHDGAAGHGPLVWYAEAGYYLRGLAGLIDPGSLYDGNNWAWDVRTELRYALWAGRVAVLFARHETSVLNDLDDKAYWRDRIGMEAMLLRGGFGTSLFANYNLLDEHPRDARDRIVEVGLRVFF